MSRDLEVAKTLIDSAWGTLLPISNQNVKLAIVICSIQRFLFYVQTLNIESSQSVHCGEAPLAHCRRLY